MMIGKKNFNNIKDLIVYRNNILLKARARTKHFNDKNKNYYWYRLQEIDQLIKKEYNPNHINNLGLFKIHKE